ncbi:MAG: STAS domain-containing protein [Chitinispirillaceae bacterium]|nr:STAS domain-containing protein [Chitinispirillaceae bacterium]
MEIETVGNNGFQIAILKGPLSIASFSSLTPALSSLIQKFPDNDLVLDLSGVPSIDTNAIRLLLNLKKRLEGIGCRLYLLNPENTLRETITTSASGQEMSIISDISELQRSVNRSTFETLRPYTFEEAGYSRFRATCGICGSNHVYGYLLNENEFTWQWPENDYFPECITREGESFDYFAALPIVCSDCYTASIDISHFNLVDENGAIKRHSSYSDQIKLLLSKGIKKRKKLLEELNVIIADSFFQSPRKRLNALGCYMLAETCAKIASVHQSANGMFTVGYLNYITLFFAEPSMKQNLIDNCRTWLTQAIASPDECNHTQLAISHFIIFIASLSLQKYKDLRKIMEDFSELMKNLGSVSDSSANLESPLFWYNRAETIWKEEIAKKSSVIMH